MQVKDLEKEVSLSNIKIKTPKGVVGYWKSQWQKGVWLCDGKTDRIYPQFVDDIKDCLEWEVTDEKVNCNKRTDYYSTNNCKK